MTQIYFNSDEPSEYGECDDDYLLNFDSSYLPPKFLVTLAPQLGFELPHMYNYHIHGYIYHRNAE